MIIVVLIWSGLPCCLSPAILTRRCLFRLRPTKIPSRARTTLRSLREFFEGTQGRTAWADDGVIPRYFPKLEEWLQEWNKFLRSVGVALVNRIISDVGIQIQIIARADRIRL